MTEQRVVETHPPVEVYCRFQSFLTQMSPKRISLRLLKKEILATNNVVKNVSDQLERRFKNSGMTGKSRLQAAFDIPALTIQSRFSILVVQELDSGDMNCWVWHCKIFRDIYR
ncbi:MAG: hypothetical protein ACE5H0_12605 [Bacteroidota bacterium]